MPDEGSTPSGPIDKTQKKRGIKVLEAALPVLTRKVRVQVPLVPLEYRHWSFSGEDSAPVMRRRGFESHPVLLRMFFDNPISTLAPMM